VYGSEGLYREGNPTRQAEEVGGAIEIAPSLVWKARGEMRSYLQTLLIAPSNFLLEGSQHSR
jgi:hypothetical protein